MATEHPDWPYVIIGYQCGNVSRQRVQQILKEAGYTRRKAADSSKAPLTVLEKVRRFFGRAGK